MYDLGSRIKEAREKRGLSQRELASRVSKSPSAISSYESSVQTPPTDVLISIARALHVSIAYLIDWNNNDCFSTSGLSEMQIDFLDQLFKEFTCPTEKLSLQQTEIIRKLILLFSAE